MKRIFLIIIFVVIAIGAYQAWNLPSYEPTQQEILPPVSPTSAPNKKITVKGQTINYAIIITQPSNVSLIANFSAKKTSDELIGDTACIAGINGGFYDTSNRPLGLFSINGMTLRDKSSSMLINGFFGVTNEDSPFITPIPRDDVRFILQTGPLLISQGIPYKLAIRKDEHTRRMIAAITTGDAILFIALYQSDAVFDGPLLADVPEFISEINKKELLNITEAINLDGGSASAFYNGETTLSELTSIGSLFCVK